MSSDQTQTGDNLMPRQSWWTSLMDFLSSRQQEQIAESRQRVEGSADESLKMAIRRNCETHDLLKRLTDEMQGRLDGAVNRK